MAMGDRAYTRSAEEAKGRKENLLGSESLMTRDSPAKMISFERELRDRGKLAPSSTSMERLGSNSQSLQQEMLTAA
jgi:hypothetical protein